MILRLTTGRKSSFNFILLNIYSSDCFWNWFSTHKRVYEWTTCFCVSEYFFVSVLNIGNHHPHIPTGREKDTCLFVWYPYYCFFVGIIFFQRFDVNGWLWCYLWGGSVRGTLWRANRPSWTGTHCYTWGW